MGVIADLLTVEDDEHGGETAFDRLDYQTCWGISRVVELHSTPGKPSYAVAFEFHEDIAEVDNPASPSFLRLYQLKTKKTGGWTLASIAKAKGGTKPSFAGRMHVNLQKFNGLAEKIVFVSNQPLTEAKGASGEFPFAKADTKTLTKFIDAVKVERPTFSEKDDLARFRFLDCGLHLDTYDKTVIGQITLFLADEIGGDVDGKQFYLTLGFQCRERSKNLADLTSIEQLVASKFVTRDSVAADLDRLRTARVRRPKWDDVASRLNLHHREERELRDAWLEYEMTRIARATPATMKLTADLRARVVPIIDSASNLMEGANQAATLVRSDVEAVLGRRTEQFAVAASLYEYLS
jgi:hypothetical protein